MLAVPIRDTSCPASRVVTEPIPDVGQAVLDRITALPRTWLIGDEPVAELHPDRQAEVGRRICDLIARSDVNRPEPCEDLGQCAPWSSRQWWVLRGSPSDAQDDLREAKPVQHPGADQLPGGFDLQHLTE
jgi:hypothetical protein